MNNDLLFIPILKNKAIAEPNAIKACSKIFSNRIIPYIEIINENAESRGYINTKRELGDLVHFEQFYRRKDSTLSDIIKKTINNTRTNIIPSLHLLDEKELIDNIDITSSFIDTIHNKHSNLSIRIPTFTNFNLLNGLMVLLENEDYLIFDIDDNDYKSLTLFFNAINRIPKKCKIIIFSNERPKNSTNKGLADLDYNLSFNTSVIDSIISNSFNQDGFGSYCAAKNDLNQGGSYKYLIYGAFVIYDYDKNSFFSIKSNTKDHASKAYSQLKSKIKQNRSIIDKLFFKTPISYNYINKLLDNENKKGSAAQYISFSIIHYIEEIYNNLFI